MVFEQWRTIFVTFVAGTSLLVIIRKFFRRKAAGVCLNNNSLEGKTVVITGANTGIGWAVAKDLAKRKARVILACRNIESAEKAITDINKEFELGHGANLELVVKQLDLSSFNSIRSFANDLISNERCIDVLINNAAVFGCPFSHTQDGLEMTFGVNHIGHFLLTNLLLENMSAACRIIIVASKLYEKAKIDFDNLNAEKFYNKSAAYAQSKLANLFFAHELNKKLPKGVTVNSLHPGFVATDLPRHMLNTPLKRFLYPLFSYLFMRSPTEGAQTVIYLATAVEVAEVSGKYFGDCKEEALKPNVINCETAKKLWNVSAKLCGLQVSST